ncbi:hypothetical protein MUA04_08925 [Enterobacteriaceae bacterium H11S18]|uniref:hypothetical protein n=1 Tax=Dryocola clanedunensis TaxID=2925396 RepID=UPI0022F0F670|nr:hypothetical protein [Dryocola clanedunensis]MCT4710310.1 hypothetical protein [Dryocola clanedunensis]
MTNTAEVQMKPVSEERANFEAWYSDFYGIPAAWVIEHRHYDRYVPYQSGIDLQWIGWQARAKKKQAMNKGTEELIASMKAAAIRARSASEDYAANRMSITTVMTECEEFNNLSDGPENIITLIAALEQAQLRIANPDKWTRDLEESLIFATDRNAELEARIPELEASKSAVNEIIDKVCLAAAEIHNRGNGVTDDKAQFIIDRIRVYLEVSKRPVKLPKGFIWCSDDKDGWLNKSDVIAAIQAAGGTVAAVTQEGL